MPVAYKNLNANLKDRIFGAIGQADGVIYDPGRHAQNALVVSQDITADDTVVIGTLTFQCKVINTDTTRTGSLSAATAGTLSLLTASGAITWNDGDLVRLENEICKIHKKLSTTQAWVFRGRCGTSTAVHAVVSIFQASAVHATHVPFGVVATLTPAVWGPSLAAEINNALGTATERATAKASTIFDPGSTYSDADRAGKLVAHYITNALVVRSAIPEVIATDTTEGLTHASNVWINATLVLGAVPAVKRTQSYSITPNGAEDTANNLRLFVPFLPTTVNVAVRGIGGVVLAFDGGIVVTAVTDGAIITVDQVGTIDWAATSTVTVTAIE